MTITDPTLTSLAYLVLSCLPSRVQQEQDPKPDGDTGDSEAPPDCEAVTSDVPEADTTEESYGCVAVCHLCGDEHIDGITVSGEIAGGEPGNVLLVAPCDDGAEESYQKDYGTADQDNGAGRWTYANDKSDPQIDCDSFGDADGDWYVYLPAVDAGTCADYGEIEREWVYNTEEYGDKAADSPKPGCTPGSGTFGLIVERWRDNEVGWARMSPILLDGNDYPEWAWLRDVEVTAWVDADSLHILKYGYVASVSNGAVVTTNTVALNVQNDSASPASGVVPMGTWFATDGLAFDAGSLEMPTITMEWTCEQASPPNLLHYQNINPPQAYGARIKELSGLGLTTIDQRIILRVDVCKEGGGVALQGRHHDRVMFPIKSEGTGVWSSTTRTRTSGPTPSGSSRRSQCGDRF